MCRVDLCFTITKSFALFRISFLKIQHFFSPLYLFFLFWEGWREEKASSSALSCFSHTIIYDIGHEQVHKGQEGDRRAGMGFSGVRHVGQTCWLPRSREGISGWTACPVMNLEGKKAPLRHKKKGTQVTQTGFQEQPTLLSFLFAFFCFFSQHSFFPSTPFPSPLLYPREAKEAWQWQPVSDGGLMGRANCFLCFVQMYK